MICAAESEPLIRLVSGGPWKLTLRDDKIPAEKTVPCGGEAAGDRLGLSTAGPALTLNAGMPIRGYACHSNLRTYGLPLLLGSQARRAESR